MNELSQLETVSLIHFFIAKGDKMNRLGYRFKFEKSIITVDFDETFSIQECYKIAAFCNKNVFDLDRPVPDLSIERWWNDGPANPVIYSYATIALVCRERCNPIDRIAVSNMFFV